MPFSTSSLLSSLTIASTTLSRLALAINNSLTHDFLGFEGYRVRKHFNVTLITALHLFIATSFPHLISKHVHQFPERVSNTPSIEKNTLLHPPATSSKITILASPPITSHPGSTFPFSPVPYYPRLPINGVKSSNLNLPLKLIKDKTRHNPCVSARHQIMSGHVLVALISAFLGGLLTTLFSCSVPIVRISYLTSICDGESGYR
jgi:hypothetical protein